MSEPLFPHGVTCADCERRLLPGGDESQRVYERPAQIPPLYPWEAPDGALPVYELVCKACFEKGGV